MNRRKFGSLAARAAAGALFGSLNHAGASLIALASEDARRADFEPKLLCDRLCFRIPGPVALGPLPSVR